VFILFSLEINVKRYIQDWRCGSNGRVPGLLSKYEALSSKTPIPPKEDTYRGLAEWL
jgi:hypothetical protein